jgi:hypothetical protein
MKYQDLYHLFGCVIFYKAEKMAEMSLIHANNDHEMTKMMFHYIIEDITRKRDFSFWKKMLPYMNWNYVHIVAITSVFKNYYLNEKCRSVFLDFYKLCLLFLKDCEQVSDLLEEIKNLSSFNRMVDLNSCKNS